METSKTLEKTEEAVTVVKDFDSMALSENLLRGVYGYGFERPSLIQQMAIVPVASGRDVLAQAQSGSGKTGAYSIGLLQRVDPNANELQALVLTPTRELAMQVGDVVAALGERLPVRDCVCTGGTNVRAEMQAARNAQVVVGTPGRVLDHLQRGLSAAALRVLVLDEADEMLSAGFRDALMDIVQRLPEQLQVVVFSATYTSEALSICERLLKNEPLRIIVPKAELPLQGIGQYVVDVGDARNKAETLLDLFDSISVSQSMVFCNSRRQVDWLADFLRRHDFSVTVTHSELDTAARRKALSDFRAGHTRVLLTTDVLARGIDVQQVGLVLNYDLPSRCETYVHRIGRCGRFGRKGVAISFATGRDDHLLHDLEHQFHYQLKPLPVDVRSLILA